MAVIIPSWTGEVTRLLASLDRQTFRDYEVQVVRRVSPAARARNIGVGQTRGPILVFIDDDAYFGHERVLERLVAVLDGDPAVTVVGSSKLTPPASGRFQRAVARQVPRMVYDVQTHDTESNPPLQGYGFSALSTTCCAMRRETFLAIGGFDDQLPTAEDTDLLYRIRRTGGRMVVAANTWVYHDPPRNLRELLRKSFWYGRGHALEALKDPTRGMDILRLGTPWGKLRFTLAVPAFPLALFIHPYFDPVRRWVIGFRPLKMLSTYAVLAGYVYGWFRGHPVRRSEES